MTRAGREEAQAMRIISTPPFSESSDDDYDCKALQERRGPGGKREGGKADTLGLLGTFHSYDLVCFGADFAER